MDPTTCLREALQALANDDNETTMERQCDKDCRAGHSVDCDARAAEPLRVCRGTFDHGSKAPRVPCDCEAYVRDAAAAEEWHTCECGHPKTLHD